MNARLVCLAAVGLLFALVRPAAAEVADLADLAPAQSVAYLELHDPSTLARELQAILKGSYLQQPAQFYAAQFRKDNKPRADEAFLLTWMGSPEFVAELGDWQGGFLAMTGLTKKDEPILVGVLRTGKSRMFPLALRLMLMEIGSLRCIARVEGVPIFQVGDADVPPPPNIARRLRAPAVQLARLMRTPRKTSLYQVALLDNAPVEEPEEMPEYGCFVSLMPGAVAFGTTPGTLTDTIRRMKGKSTAPSLATAPGFRAAAEMRRQPGLFVWSDPPRLTRLINEALRRDLDRSKLEARRQLLADGKKHDAEQIKAHLRQVEVDQQNETREWTFFQKIANPDGMHYAAAGWSLHRGETACRFEVRMREKQTSPLLDLLSNQKLSAELLQATPREAFCLFAVSLSNGAATLARLLKLADAHAAGSGEEMPLPSKGLEELEKTLKLRLGRDVLSKIRAAAVALHLVEGKETGVHPVFLVEAISPDAAKELEALVPRLYGGKLPEPHRHTIDGQRVNSLTDEEADTDMEGPPPHYGRRGKLLVLGWRRAAVAAVLHDSTSKKDLLSLPHGLATVEAEGPVGALGLFSCHQLLAHLARIGTEAADQDAAHCRVLHYLREMCTPMASMPPTMFCLKRLSDGVRVEFRQGELPVASATVVDVLMTWMLDGEAASSGWMNLWFGPQRAPLAPAPPPGWVVPPAAPPAIAPAPAPAAPAPPPPPPDRLEVPGDPTTPRPSRSPALGAGSHSVARSRIDS